MKVAELFLAEETLKDYSERLISTLNIKKLGSGAYAHVFQHPAFRNVVAKVFTNKDATHRKYLTWCMQNQNNKYVPQIISMVPVKSETDDKYNIVFMQKMSKVSSNRFGNWLGDYFGEDAEDAYEDEDWEEIYRLMNNGIRFSKDADLKSIWAHIKSYGANRFDLHADNVMLRGQQIVFSDPVGSAPKAGTRIDGHDQ